MQRLGRAGEWLFLFLLFSYQLSWAQKLETELRSASGDSAEIALGEHQVQSGETYYQLSRKYRVPVDSLIKWNGESLPVGKTIRIHSPAQATTKKSDVPNPDSVEISIKLRPEKNFGNQKPAGTTLERAEEPEVSNQPRQKNNQRVLIIPFDPYLYFSDADDDIARQSEIPKQQIRYIFRSSLNSSLNNPHGFESVNLLSASNQNNTDELRNIYKHLSYSYQQITYSRFNPLPKKQKPLATGPKAWFQKQKEKAGLAKPKEEGVAAEAGNYYGVQVKDSALYGYLNNQYNSDYYLFINQFEIHTDYTNCIDRTTQNFLREFLVHYTIINAKGELIAGNKIKIPYESNVNNIDKIVRDNLGKMAQLILSDLPQAQVLSSEARQN